MQELDLSLVGKFKVREFGKWLFASEDYESSFVRI